MQLIDATGWFKPLRKNLGKKNCELSDDDIEHVMKTLSEFRESEQSKIFENAALGYWKVTVERPLRIKGIDTERTYSPKEIKELKSACGVDPTASPVIRKIHKSGVADPIGGLFEARIKGKRCIVEYEPDSELRDSEQVPLIEDGGIAAFIKREVIPYAPDAWVNEEMTKVGYEISFNRYFSKPQPLRSLSEIRADIVALERETEGLLKEIVGDSL